MAVVRHLDADPILVTEGRSYDSVTEEIGSIVTRPGPRKGWLAGFALAFALVLLLLVSIVWLFYVGVGIWGIDIPVAWGFAIINFVWWIGIGHAGTLISAILLLLHQKWRTSINRFAEAMTLFAVACAAMFPLLHLGRPQLFYWLMPYPNTMGLWPQFRSPLVWDLFAVMTYGLVSLMFWYLGLIPDLATMRDRARSNFARTCYGLLALGWRGASRHWSRYQTAYLLLAGLATPLVLSVHSVVSLDFSVSILPGWHSTIFPPYFVAGAIFSGFAMVLTITIPLRAAYGLHGLVTERHLDNMAKVMLATGLMVGYGYVMEGYMGWYSGHDRELFMLENRYFGPYGHLAWVMSFCNVGVIQLLWFRRLRRSVPLLFVIALLVNVGMWLERYVIVVVSLHRDFLPSSWGMYTATFWDWATFVGTLGLFTALLYLFVRLLPAISMAEVRELLHEKAGDAAARPSPFPASVGVDRAAPVSAQYPDEDLHGLLAAYETPEQVLGAARRAREQGYRRLEAYTPFPVEGLPEAVGFERNRVALLVLLGGILGGSGGFLMQWIANVVDYPLNIGGKPFNSWPAFIPITFEMTVLFGALSGMIGMLVLNRLPRLHHPLFEIPDFDRATQDRFFLHIAADDPAFDRLATSRMMSEVGAERVFEVAK